MNAPIRAAVIFAVVSLMTLSARALPITASSIMSSSNAADRDVVRNPYTGFALNRAPVSVSPSGNIPAFAPPALLLGGGGGGGISPFSATSIAASGFVAPPRSYLYTAPAQSGGVYFALTNTTRQSNVVVGPVQVPVGGETLVLLGLSLIGLFLARRSHAIATLLRN